MGRGSMRGHGLKVFMFTTSLMNVYYSLTDDSGLELMYTLLDALAAVSTGLNKCNHRSHLWSICLCSALCKALFLKLWPADWSPQTITRDDEMHTKIKVARNFVVI